MSAKIIPFPDKAERQSQALFDFFGISLTERRRLLAQTSTCDEVVNVTALWNELGRKPVKSPERWWRTDSARSFCAHIAEQTGLSEAELWFLDEAGERWAHYQLAMAFAEWVSHAYLFHVNQQLGAILGFK